MTAVLFGSISTVADTSELQRAAFNNAFAQHGLDWEWSQDEYRSLLTGNGGSQRIADYASSKGTEVDADAVHATKSSLFQQSLASAPLTARPGVVETIKTAKSQGHKVGLVTTTVKDNITALLAALPDVSAEDFDVIVDLTSVDKPKPDAAAYTHALEVLGASAADSVAVEDNPGGVEAANAAGVACVAFPNTNTAAQDFSAATARVDVIDLDALTQALSQR